MSVPTPPDDLELVIVVAVAENGVIGKDGSLPWHYPDDLKRFKRLTMGHPVIVGRQTFEDIYERLDGPLPGRTNIVLSRHGSTLPADVVHADSLATAYSIAAEQETVAFVIGGASVYEATLPVADRLELTEIKQSYEGDTLFPTWPLGEQWQETATDERAELRFRTLHRTD